MLSQAVLIARKLPFFYLNPFVGFKVERGFVKAFGLLGVFIANPVSTPPKSFVMKKKDGKSAVQEMLVPLAIGSHLFPFRTESLSLSALMVLGSMPRESKSVPTQYNSPCLLTKARGFLFPRLCPFRIPTGPGLSPSALIKLGSMFRRVGISRCQLNIIPLVG